MTEDKPIDALAPKTADYVASAAKAALGAVPFAGSLLAELAGTVIPNQRIDRIVGFAAELEQRLAGIEHVVRAQLSTENFTDLMEEALRQAARSTSDDRRRHIANVIANSLRSDDISFVESKHLLRLLGEINDIEVVWLRFYLHSTVGGDEAFRSKHGEVLAPVAPLMGSPQPEIDRKTLQDSYQQHLCQLGLLRERYRTDPRTKLPEFDQLTRSFKLAGYELTPLGRLLLRQVGFTETSEAG